VLVQGDGEHDSLRLLGRVEMLGSVDAGINAIYTFTRADVSVNGIAELTVAVRLPDVLQLVRHGDRLPNSRLQ